MNDIEVDFTFPQESVDIEPITEDDYDFSIFAVKGDKGDAGQDGQDGADGQDGKGISSVVKTSTSGLIDTYTITYTDNTTSTFQVTNGQNGANGQDGRDGTDGQDGANGRDGYVQYTAGDNITIENNVISATGGGDEADLYIPVRGDQTQETTTDSDTLATASEIINYFYNSNQQFAKIWISTRMKGPYLYTYNKSNSSKLDTQVTSYIFRVIIKYMDSSSFVIGGNVEIKGTWNDNIFTCSKITHYFGTSFYMTSYPTFGDVLAKTNTTSFTPTGDYHPATKKYVDDQVGAINTVLATLTTPGSDE